MELQEVIDHVRNEHKSDLAKQIAEALGMTVDMIDPSLANLAPLKVLN